MNSKSSTLQIIVVIVLAVILLASIFIIRNYLNDKNHDYMVMSDIAQIKSALALSFSYNNYYPKIASATPLNDVYMKTEKLCKQGFVSSLAKCEIVLLDKIPVSNSGEVYQYFSTSEQNYFLEFNLITNNKSLGLLKGQNCATQDAYYNGSCVTQ